jgi:hypothetical protein
MMTNTPKSLTLVTTTVPINNQMRHPLSIRLLFCGVEQLRVEGLLRARFGRGGSH